MLTGLLLVLWKLTTLPGAATVLEEAKPHEHAPSLTSTEFIGRCILEVRGVRFLNGNCPIVLWSNGTFSVGTSTHNPSSRYFAYVIVADKGTANGFWNADPPLAYAQTNLGRLVKDGDCWTNASARICMARMN
jgi:hypothetical protein